MTRFTAELMFSRAFHLLVRARGDVEDLDAVRTGVAAEDVASVSARGEVLQPRGKLAVVGTFSPNLVSNKRTVNLW